MKRPPCCRLFLSCLLFLAIPALAAEARKPNIVLIYADDLGYGDTSAYGATRIRTPNIDRLAKEGLRFTDGHCTSSTCTPSRYSMLTGEYAFRKRGTGVLPGNAPLIIEPGRTTLASVLKDAGYKTGVVGKWHLGLGTAGLDWNSDWSQPAVRRARGCGASGGLPGSRHAERQRTDDGTPNPPDVASSPWTRMIGPGGGASRRESGCGR